MDDLWTQAQQLAKKNEENWDEFDKYEREDCVWWYYYQLLAEKENVEDMNGKLVCPNCGTEMKLPEKSEIVMGVTLSKESGGTHVLEADVIKNCNLNSTKLNKENTTMRDERMNVLANAGVDVSKFFNVILPNGDVVKMTMGDNGVPIVVNDVADDPILNQIIEDGYVRNTKLHRRWVMAQMFRMLNFQSYYGREHGYDAYLRTYYGYMYQFDMMLEEVRILSKLEDRDAESFNERSQFFTKDVIVRTYKDYLVQLKAYIDSQKPKNCKGVPYKRVKGQNVFVDDLHKKVYGPIEGCILRIERAKNYKELYGILKAFNSEMIKLRWNTPKCKVWIDAFKGSGAYYTLKNLVMYHNCKIVDVQGSKRYGSTRTETVYNSGIEAVKFIQSKLNEYKGEGWRYMAMLKKCIADNNFSFEQRMKEIYSK